MSKNTLSSKVSKKIGGVLHHHGPEILTGIGIAGMITTTVMAVRATPKALSLIEDGRWEKADYEDIRIDDVHWTALDTVKSAWLCYVPATMTGLVSVICLVGASSVNAKRNAALATAYALSETALKEYQSKVVETIGVKKEHEVRDAVAKEKIQKHPIKNDAVIFTKNGNTLCYDVISGRYFRSDIELLKKTANELNRRLIVEEYISLNDFYYEIDLENIRLGDDLGWHIDGGLIEFGFSSQLASDGTPCLVLDYSIAPEYQARK